jgi:uncharacterized membrane protein
VRRALLLAAAGHLLAVRAVPRLVMRRVMGVVAETGGVNHAVPVPRQGASDRTVIRPSPDILYTVCAYDVSLRPLRITAPLPRDSYGSLALFASNTDVFFVRNDRQADGAVDVVLARPGTAAEAPDGATVVTAASTRGLVLLRYLIEDEARVDELDALRRTTVCAPL